MNGIEVKHDPAGGRFVAEVEGQEAVMAYRRVDDSTVDFVSTFTPPDLRGRGIARDVVETALAWAENEGLRVVPSCWYVKKVLESREAAS